MDKNIFFQGDKARIIYNFNEGLLLDVPLIVSSRPDKEGSLSK
jgi:hypothetical protein